jgi:hypothetical protein
MFTLTLNLAMRFDPYLFAPTFFQEGHELIYHRGR